MFKKFNLIILMLCGSFLIAQELTKEQQEEIKQKTLEEFAKIIFSNAMEAKRAFQQEQVREEIIENFATTAPRSEFIVNADISSELAAGVDGATIYVSADGQNTWQSADANLLGTIGYENTWEGIVNTGDGNTVHSYLSGVVESGVLGDDLDFGTIIVSGSPHNSSGSFPPGSNMYATLVNDEQGDTSSDYDILSVRGTYLGEEMEDADGNVYTDVERFYVSLDLNGGCCDAGGLFGPWYLYGVGLVNPEATSDVAYAVGWGDGGFGQLTPGLLKVSGDLASGDVAGFEYISTNIAYNTNGNSMQATALMDLLTNDPEWGVWPNSYNGFIALGVTVEASLSGLDVAADVKDQTNPGLLICTTTTQTGNVPLVLSNPNFDVDSNTLSVDYSDADGNLPWFKSAQICYPNDGACFFSTDMIPNSHTYEEGVTFSVSFTDDDIGAPPGDYDAKFWFADADIDEYPSAQITIPITVGGSGCGLVGDTNGDSTLNVLDVVLLVNIILDANASGDNCSDVNGDGAFNVLDVVLLVNLILNP